MNTTQQEHPTSMSAPRPYRILVAVAFESTAEAALHEAMRLALKNANSELHVVHAVAGSVTGEDPASEAARKASAEVVALLRSRIEAAWQDAGEIQVIAHIRSGHAAESILRVAAEVSADVIVVGSHRRTGLSKLMLGSVAEDVLHRSHCPVLIAVPKNYSDTTASVEIEPACEECLSTRKSSANARFWCERHSKPHLQPHVYVPRDVARSSIFPTY